MVGRAAHWVVAWLALRRLRQARRALITIGKMLMKMIPKTEQVIYPGLPKHPQHALAARQMQGFGGMIAAYLKGDLTGTRQFLERCHLFTLAESLGGVESLIEPSRLASLRPSVPTASGTWAKPGGSRPRAR